LILMVFWGGGFLLQISSEVNGEEG